MAGPGGGGRSGGGGSFGGGGRGGFGGGHGGFGGGFHGGHHHRPHHRPYHGHHWGGWHFGPRHHGGGCLSGIAAIIFIIVFLLVFLFSAITEIAQGGSLQYDEKALQDYANAQYNRIFSDTAFEDNILLVVLTDETCTEYTYIAWVGDHVAEEVNWMLGNNDTELGQAMSVYISGTDYTYNLDTGLRSVVKVMAQKIQGLDLESNLTCRELGAETVSRLYNETNLPLTEDTVNSALVQFTEMTGIPCCIVVEDMDAVFEQGFSFGAIALLVVIGIVLLCVVVSFVKKRRSRQNPDDDQPQEDRHRDPF